MFIALAPGVKEKFRFGWKIENEEEEQRKASKSSETEWKEITQENSVRPKFFFQGPML